MMGEYKSLHAAFADVVKKYPDNVAIRYRGNKLTYMELDTLSNYIAGLLTEKLPDYKTAAIAILAANHSVMRYIYMLAVLKAGFTYVPLDAKAISNRSRRILELSEAKLLLTEIEYRDFADDIVGKGLLDDDSVLFESIDKLEKTEYRSAENDVQRSAYVIFTSGSTGEPKGVEVQDKAVLNFTESIISKLDISCNDKTLSLSNFSFDASVFDMYPFLLSGAEIILINEHDRQSISGLNKYMDDNGVTIQCITTALYHLMLNEKNKNLKKLCVIGEKMLTFKEKSYEIYNMYGPTEATCLVTLDKIEENSDDIPAGYPIDNVDIRIVDENLKELRSGERGQILISGICLAKGYRNNPEETEKRFINLKNGKRAYLTGDIGSMDPYGNLHCFGRMDNQVKFKGYRIELDEIRKALLKINGIEDAAVLLINEKYTSYLASALVADPALSSDVIRYMLIKELPEYMVPQKIKFLEEFPLNRNKKIDTDAIREIIRAEYFTDDGNCPCTTRSKCINIWSKILCIKEDEVKEDMSFKALGGNSLQMLMMIAEIGRLFDIKIPFEDFIKKPDISNMISIIDKMQKGKQHVQTANL